MPVAARLGAVAEPLRRPKTGSMTKKATAARRYPGE
ncbi:hypothetical protein BJ965_006902 [Streptomyces luteogriseus]|uniref:Uncharacterized protein n=1 Tax=Streptomyces luteogriseus TaxID=68233 RepID=A0A7W7GLV0_9ACTN|nr:hypothetical protein [Streptomyces luteogriseus]